MDSERIIEILEGPIIQLTNIMAEAKKTSDPVKFVPRQCPIGLKMPEWKYFVVYQ